MESNSIFSVILSLLLACFRVPHWNWTAKHPNYAKFETRDTFSKAHHFCYTYSSNFREGNLPNNITQLDTPYLEVPRCTGAGFLAPRISWYECGSFSETSQQSGQITMNSQTPELRLLFWVDSLLKHILGWPWLRSLSFAQTKTTKESWLIKNLSFESHTDGDLLKQHPYQIYQYYVCRIETRVAP